MIQTDKVAKNMGITPVGAVGAIGPLLATGVTLLAAKAVIDTTQQLATGKPVPKKERATHYTDKAINNMLRR